ncbi:MAG TPA: hemerythrin domain-containing protein [Polyangia bacterium]|jgi:hypothetical protein
MRLDVLTPIHKGLRRKLFETAIALGRTDFSSPEETAAAERLVGECLTYLREHAEHEDRHVLPIVARLAPELAAVLAAEHPELERAAIAADSLWPRFAALAAEERQAMGAELARRFQALVAMQLRHMDREEREVNAAFWAGMSDGDIAALSRRIASEIPPARMLNWQRQVLLPAWSAPEIAAAAARMPAPA